MSPSSRLRYAESHDRGADSDPARVHRMVFYALWAARIYTIGPNERAVVSTFGRAQRVSDATTLMDPIAESLRADERDRYAYPQVRVVGPGFYWKLPWQRVHKVSIATLTVSIAFDPEDASANQGGSGGTPPAASSSLMRPITIRSHFSIPARI